MKTRHRTRGHASVEQNAVICVYSPVLGPQLAGVGVCTPRNSAKVEVFDDVVGAQQEEFNPCIHYELLGSISPLDNFSSGSVAFPGGSYSFNNGGPYPSTLLDALLATAFLDPQYLDDFSVDAELHFKTAVSDSSSLINFILEFIEMLEGNLKSLKSLSEKFAKAIKTYWRVLQTSGSHWVAWNFAIKPALRDVKNFLSTLKRAQARLKFLKARNHKPTKIKYRRSPVDFQLANCLITQEGWWDGTFDTEEGPVSILPVDWGGFSADMAGTVQVSSWAMVQWDIPDYLLDDFTLAIGMISMIMNGLYNPVKIIWEAIPFSWLIEWFTSKRAMLLKELGNMSPFPDATILATGHSIKVKILTGEVFAEKIDLPDEGSSAARISLGNFQWESYVRKQGLPTGELALVAQGLDLRQSSILGGIAVNWRRRR